VGEITGVKEQAGVVELGEQAGMSKMRQLHAPIVP
jgi:hypothetical protein